MSSQNSNADPFDRDFMVDIIQVYKERPCLWQVTNEDYHDRDKRNCALDDLLYLFQTKDPQANRETVQKRFSSMRSSYNKELRKVKASQAAGSRVHKPRLWYFEHFTFLHDKGSTTQNLKTASAIFREMPYCEEESIDIHSSPDLFENQPSPSSQLSNSSRSSTACKRPPPKTELILEKIPRRMDEPIDSDSVKKHKKLHTAYGEHIAEKLRNMPSSMVPFCQRLINEAIFLSDMNSLNMSSRIVTDVQIDPLSTSIGQEDFKGFHSTC